MMTQADGNAPSLTRDSREILDHVADGVYVVDRNRRIVLWNRGAERVSGFSEQEVRGRCCADNILTHVDNAGCQLCTGNCPLAYTLKDGKVHEAVVNLHHKDGYRVPVEVSVRPLCDESGAVIGAVETFRECSASLAMRAVVEHLKQWGCVDIATGLVNKRVMEMRIGERLHEMSRFGWVFAVLLIEIDFLKELRVRWGDEGTRAIVRMAAQSVQNSLRPTDTVGRWDDGVFLAVIANTTIAEIALIAERVRMMVETAYRVTPDGEMRATVSIGAAAAQEGDNEQSLVHKAERSAYMSRAKGRNRVSVFGFPEDDG